MTRWAQSRRLRATPGSRCGGVSVVFNTQERRPGRVALLWAVVCGRVKRQASFSKRRAILERHRGPVNHYIPLWVSNFAEGWMSSLISVQSESGAGPGRSGDEEGVCSNCSLCDVFRACAGSERSQLTPSWAVSAHLWPFDSEQRSKEKESRGLKMVLGLGGSTKWAIWRPEKMCHSLNEWRI